MLTIFQSNEEPFWQIVVWKSYETEFDMENQDLNQVISCSALKESARFSTAQLLRLMV
ncbi:hypothetical protein CANARDRAFT_175429 [[Candida] arabinofermentans NRRL YB-2248]|uniref:Uncharacterized protein n=1 Tax=[Candida] arabinofermentans NRRL YB-2248 TaxID=983967 RepID=A0A1E4T477_9ASCO|nr:hypothetical protein CANARDRAFT_175429 [[Candida] arabinofermentans NRRL YB-2248]